MKTSKKSQGKIGKVGIVLAGVAAASAGAYYFLGTKEGKKTKKQIENAATKVKKEVLSKIKILKEVDAPKYKEAVLGVVKKYQKIAKEHEPEIKKAKKEMLSHWKNIKKHIESRSK